jgi:hypothetical protein
MTWIILLLEDLDNSRPSGKNIFEIIWDIISGVLTVGSLILHVWQVRAITALAKATGLKAIYDSFTETGYDAFDDYKNKDNESILQKFFEWMKYRQLSMDTKPLLSLDSLARRSAAQIGVLNYLSFGKSGAECFNGKNPFTAIHWNTSAFLNELYVPDVYIGDYNWDGDTETFNLYPNNYSLKDKIIDIDSSLNVVNSSIVSINNKQLVSAAIIDNIPSEIYIYLIDLQIGGVNDGGLGLYIQGL